MRTLLAALALLCASLTIAIESEDLAEGRVLFGSCAACHLATGEGVPGAFPPLKNRLLNIAATTAGREYLIQVVLQGIHGPMVVGGVPYQGYMQGYQGSLQNDQISLVLNYAVTQLRDDTVSSGFTWFDAAEIAQARLAIASATMSSLEKRNQLGLND